MAALGNLVVLAKAGDQDAQSEIILHTQNKLMKFCILLGHNRELAEDLCQETYIKAFRSLESLKNPQALQGWLYQIAKNLFIDAKRGERKTLDASVIEETASDSNMEMIFQVRQALSHFDPEERYLLLLVELEGLSYKEAAEQLNMTEDALRSRLHRLKVKFVKNFK